MAEVWDDEDSKLHLLDPGLNSVHRLESKFRRIAVVEVDPLATITGGYDSALSAASAAGASNTGNALIFSQMLDQYSELQQQIMFENMEMQKAQAFWNPLESMSKKDATS